ncbi:unnamed protein product, partial [Dovyalis caffra]
MLVISHPPCPVSMQRRSQASGPHPTTPPSYSRVAVMTLTFSHICTPVAPSRNRLAQLHTYSRSSSPRRLRTPTRWVAYTRLDEPGRNKHADTFGLACTSVA